MLRESFIKPYFKMRVPWGPIGYITYKRTYARQLDGRTEEWVETIRRCVDGVLAIGCDLSESEAEALFDHVFNLRCCFAGRSLWQLGTKTVERFGGDSLQNCYTVDVNSPITPFTFTFDELMLGGGVGFNITPESVYSLPKVAFTPMIRRVDKNDVDFIVPDNREGWVQLLHEVLHSFFYTGKHLTYSTACIRPKGQLIKTFGGIASGGEDLVQGIEAICNILSSRHTLKLRPIDCLDIMNIIGQIVVSGNVRRSAQIALGDALDAKFLGAKNWGSEPIPSWRSMSNNSVVCDDLSDLPDGFWDGYSGNGEAYGLINLGNCRRFGRLADGDDYRLDPRVCGVNPCAEITLESYEACNLAEIFLPNVNPQQFHEVAGLLYKVCKSISCLPFIHIETAEVVQRNRRIGIGVTGLLQSRYYLDANLFTSVYQHLETLDRKYSNDHNIPTSIKLTTVKPSGTVSLLAGVTPGIHPAFSNYYIRRIRMAANDSLVDLCRSKNYPIEPQLDQNGQQDLGTMVVSFPIAAPRQAICAAEMDAIQQLEVQVWMQDCWSDNSVSATVYYSHDELPAIKQWLGVNYHKLKTCSFMLHSEHAFVQAPMDAITEDEYNCLVSKTSPITNITDLGDLDGLACASGSCPVK